eukprot:s284_g27.t1
MHLCVQYSAGLHSRLAFRSSGIAASSIWAPAPFHFDHFHHFHHFHTLFEGSSGGLREWLQKELSKTGSHRYHLCVYNWCDVFLAAG